MKILITGIHGFVGANLVKALANSHSIYGLDIISPAKEGVKHTYIWNDLSKDKLPNDIDAIIHLAGKAHDTKNKAEAKVYFDINTGLTQMIYDFFLQSTAKKFIFFSSVKAAANQVIGDVLTEDVIPTPLGPYGESKIKAEEYILSKLPTEKQVSIVRPCMIHGPGNKGNLNLLYNIVKKGFPWPLGDFENRRSFMSIDNLCFIINGLLTKNIESGIYHVGDDGAMSTNELIETICEAMGEKPHIWKIDKRLMTTIAKVGSALKLPLNEMRLQKLTENYVVSNEKIKKALGVQKMPYTAKEGMIKTIKSFENNI